MKVYIVSGGLYGHSIEKTHMEIYFAGLNYQHDINKFLYTDYENIFSGGGGSALDY